MIDSRARGSGIAKDIWKAMEDVSEIVQLQQHEVQPDSPPPAPPSEGFMQKFRLYETRSVRYCLLSWWFLVSYPVKTWSFVYWSLNAICHAVISIKWICDDVKSFCLLLLNLCDCLLYKTCFLDCWVLVPDFQTQQGRSWIHIDQFNVLLLLWTCIFVLLKSLTQSLV